jgi:ADP-heptose:LPS heptosyltransferase
LKIQIIPWAFGIGDLIRLDPLIRGIKEKYTNSKISLFCLKNAEALKFHPCIDEFFTIWCSRCDLIYNCNSTGHGCLNVILQDSNKYKSLLGYTSSTTGDNQQAIDDFSQYVSWDKGFDFVYDIRNKNKKNLSKFLCDICDIQPSDPKIYFYLSKESEEFAQQFLKQCTKPKIIIHAHSEGKIIGTKHVSKVFGEIDLGKQGIKNWGKQKFIELINILKHNYDCILIGTKKDEQEIDEIVNATGCIVCKDRSFNNVAALIKNSDYFIGVDSGPSHVALAFEVPSITLFCKVFSYTCHPVEPKATHKFLSKHPSSIEEITVDEVYEEFKNLRKNY